MIINASGVYADIVNEMVNEHSFDIIPRRGEYSKAKSYMDEYVRYSGYFDEKGNAYPSYEICNTVRTIYYTESGHLDSAFYYLHQTAKAYSSVGDY